MKYKVEFMETAQRDASEIRDYLKQYYPGTANKFIDALDNSTNMLKDNPYIGLPYSEYRKLVVGVYLVFYKVREDERAVKIYRILHGAQNYDVNSFAEKMRYN